MAKFETALHKGEAERVVNVHALKEVCARQPALYEREYRDKLYCPECGEAQLTFFANAATPHLKTRAEREHDAACSKSVPPIAKKASKEYFENKDFATLNTRALLSAALKLLLRGQRRERSPFVVYKGEKLGKAALYDTNSDTEKRKRASLPYKLITNGFEGDEYDVYSVFYGEVSVRAPSKNEKSYFKLFPVDGEKEICSLSVPAYVRSLLPCEYFTGRPYRAYVAFIAAVKCVEKAWGNKTLRFNNAVLLCPDRLVIERI